MLSNKHVHLKQYLHAPANVSYIEKDKGSWKHTALGTEKKDDTEIDQC